MAYELGGMLSLGGDFVAQMQKALDVTERMEKQAQQTSKQVNDMSKIKAIGQKISSGLSQARDAFGAVGIASAGFLKGCIDKAGAAQKINADLAQTIKSTGGAAGLTADQVVQMADSFAKATAFGAGTIKQGQNMLLTFTNIGKETFPMATQAMLDMAQKMGTEPVAASIQLGKALNDPSKGLTALTRVGVTFTERQKKQIETMQKAGNMAGAQKVILNELNREFGGQAQAAAQTYDGRMKQLGNTIGSIKSSIGTALLPYVQKAADAFLMIAQKVQSIPKPTMDVIAKVLGLVAVFGSLIGGTSILKRTFTTLFPSVGGLSGMFSKLKGPIGLIVIALAALTYAYIHNIGGFKTFVDNSIPKIENVFKSLFSFIQSHGPLIKTILAGVAGAFVAFKVYETITKAVTAFKLLKAALDAVKISQLLLNGVMAINPVVIIVVAIGALIGVLIYLWNTNKGFRTAVIGIWNEIKAVFSTVINAIKGFFTGLINHIKKIPADFAAFKNGVHQHMVDLHNKINAVLTGIKNFFITIFNGIKSGVMAIVQPFINGIMNIFNHMKTGLTNMLNGLKNIFQGVWNLIKLVVMGPVLLICDLVTGNFGKLKTDAVKIMQGIHNALNQIWSGIKQFVMGYVQALVGFVVGAFQNAKNNILAVWNAVSNFLSALWNGIWNFCKSAWTGMLNTISNILQSIGNFISNTWNGILNFFASLPSKLYQHGVSMITGLKNGVVGTIGFVSSAITNGLNGAINFIKNLPSQFLKWGADMINGLANGIKNTIGAVGNAVKGVADKIRSFLHFSRPDKGPLVDYETYMPDFMKGMAGGIKSNMRFVIDATKNVATGIRENVMPKTEKITNNTIITNNNKTADNNKGVTILIPKLADQVVIREESDIDKVATAFVKKLKGTSFNMA